MTERVLRTFDRAGFSAFAKSAAPPNICQSQDLSEHHLHEEGDENKNTT